MSKPDDYEPEGLHQTENKAVLKELESERLKKAIANSPVTIYGLDCNLRYKWVVNPKVAGSEKEMIGKKVGSAGQVTDVKPLVAFYTEVLKSGKSERRELRVDYGNQFSIFDIFAEVEKNEKGEVTGLTATSTDITERKKAEEAAKEAEKQLRIMVENSVDGINMLDLKTGKYVFMSPAQVKLTGFTAEEINNISAKEAYERTYPEDREITVAQQKKVAAGKDVSEPVEYRWKVKSGEYRWFSDSRKLVRDEQGQAIAIVGITRDITERKKAEEALSRINEELEERVQKRTQEVSSERQRLYNVLESLPAYVVLLDKDYRMPFANKVFRELFGESYGRRCHEFLFGRDSECENCETYKVLKSNKPQHWEWTGPNKHDYEIYDYPFVEADGSTRILEMGIDVTERKKAEREAQEAAKKLKDSERLAAIGATAGMVGHDIRNPLQAITGDVYLAKTELASLPESQEKANAIESLDEIETNIGYINKIVADLQDYARPLNPNRGEADLKLIIDRLLEKNGLPENVKVTVRVEDEARKFFADSDYLNRILYNLVTNAVQAMPKGGKLTIQAYKDKKDVVISVKDTGVGIPKEIQGKMFTPMFTTKAKGQGFGLPVVKRMTESLGGTVSFESEECKGTTFIIRLPPPHGAKR